MKRTLAALAAALTVAAGSTAAAQAVTDPGQEGYGGSTPMEALWLWSACAQVNFWDPNC